MKSRQLFKFMASKLGLLHLGHPMESLSVTGAALIMPLPFNVINLGQQGIYIGSIKKFLEITLRPPTSLPEISL